MNLYLLALGARLGTTPHQRIRRGRDRPRHDRRRRLARLETQLSNARVEGNELIIGTIEIGADAYIGTSCVIEDNVVIGDGAALEDLTSRPPGRASARRKSGTARPRARQAWWTRPNLTPPPSPARSAAR